MPDDTVSRSSPTKKRWRDPNQLAHLVVQIATGQVEDDVPKPSPNAAGGKARAEALTPERRSEIAKKAAAARWNRMEVGP